MGEIGEYLIPMKLKLTDSDQRILAGHSGDAAAMAVRIIVRMADKVMRLVNLRLDNPDRDPKNESIDDAFLDVAIYGAIALLCRRGDWPGVPAIDPDGEEPEKP